MISKTQMVVQELKARRDKAAQVVKAADQALALFGVIASSGDGAKPKGSTMASERAKKAWRTKRAKEAKAKKAATTQAGAPLAEAAGD